LPDLDEILDAAPVIPVLVMDDARTALPVARALVAGGLPVLEVTLRTPAALAIIRAMREVPGAIVGAGTVLDPAMLDAAIDAGAQFAVSPGLTDSLARAAATAPIPLLPGVATASEVMRARDHGFSRLKFFPATASGGLPAVKAFASVFGGLRFCPTGGITQDNAPDWLAIPAVACIGGTWLVPPCDSPDPAAIEQRARAAAALKKD